MREGEAESGARVGRQPGDVPSGGDYPAFIRRHDADHGVQQGGLSRAVRADQAEQLTGT